jgi:hypothetical protein
VDNGFAGGRPRLGCQTKRGPHALPCQLVFDFITQEEITQEELDDLPDDDPQAAFATFVRIAQRRLAQRTEKLDPRNEYDWEPINEARNGFMNVVIAAAKKYGIEPIASIDVPRLQDFKTRGWDPQGGRSVFLRSITGR